MDNSIESQAVDNKIVIKHDMFNYSGKRLKDAIIPVVGLFAFGIIITCYAIFGKQGFEIWLLVFGLIPVGLATTLFYLYLSLKIVVIDNKGIYWAKEKRMIPWNEINSLTCEIKGKYRQYFLCSLKNCLQLKAKLWRSNYTGPLLHKEISEMFPSVECRLVD